MKANVREPAFNAPWPVVVLVATLIAAHAARLATHTPVETWAVTREGLAGGQLASLITYVFVHGSWPHVLMNAVFVLAFGSPVARYLGPGGRGAAVFLVFFLACGVLSALGYAGWVDGVGRLGGRASAWGLVGASGAASGLLGAAARLIEGRGRLGRPDGRTVVGMGIGWIVANAVLGLSGLTPGAAGVPVAWEAHIVGFFVGLFLIGVAGRAAGVEGAA